MRSYLNEVWRCRYFWHSLVMMDLRTRYRRSVLGIGWSLLHPIAMTIVLCTVFHKLWGQDISSFGPFLMSGLVFWSFITATTLQGATCFYQGESYIRQYPAPMAIYPLRTTLGAAFHFLMALIPVVLLTWFLQGFGNLQTIAMLVPVVLLLLVMGWSLSVLAGLANIYFPDMQHLLEVGLQILFYATPIIWPPAMLRTRGLGWLIDYNPVAVCLELIRAPLLDGGHMPSLASFSVAVMLTLALTSMAVFALGRLQRQIIFQL